MFSAVPKPPSSLLCVFIRGILQGLGLYCFFSKVFFHPGLKQHLREGDAESLLHHRVTNLSLHLSLLRDSQPPLKGCLLPSILEEPVGARRGVTPEICPIDYPGMGGIQHQEQTNAQEGNRAIVSFALQLIGFGRFHFSFPYLEAERKR